MTSLKTTTAVAFLSTLLLLLTSCSNNDPEKPLASARDYLQKNDTKSATIQVKNALQINPELAEARYLLGTILLKEGNASGAEIELRKALAAKYPESRVVPELALSLLLQGQSQKVIDEFGELQLANSGADASLQTTLAAAYGALRKPELAESALNAALRADSDHVPALLQRARQRAAARDVEGALSIVEGALSKDARHLDALKFKGDLLLYGKGNADEAIATYRKSIEVRPDFAPGHFALLTALIQQNQLDEAGKELLELKRLAAGNPQSEILNPQ